MARKPQKSRDHYEVGYGKPPKEHQFPKDQSGNLKGRPKGSKNVKTIVNDVLHTKVEIKLNGQKRKVTSLEANLISLNAEALKGNARARKEVLDLAKTYCSEDLQKTTNDALTPDDQAILDNYLARQLRKIEAENDDQPEEGDDDAWLR